MFPGPLGGRYAIQSELASGGNGRIYLAEDLRLGRPVAVKLVVATQHAALDEGMRRLEREARVAGAINHPNVCAVSDVGRMDDGRPFLVMELLSGETLATRLGRESPLPIPLALDFAHQMLAGVDAAHKRGIIHRDIKPENMFLTQLGPGKHLLKVLDFGTAQIPGMASPHGEDLTKTGIVIGTMQYMSPEQLKGVRDFDTRTDVYSCAVVIYEMLVGQRPFGELPVDRVAEAIAFSQAPSIARRMPRLATHIVRAIDSALSVDRMRRPMDAAAFLQMLQTPAVNVTSATNVLSMARSGPSSDPRVVAAPLMPKVIPTPDEWDVPTKPRSPPQPVSGMPITIVAPPIHQAPQPDGPALGPGGTAGAPPMTVPDQAPESVPDWDLPTRQTGAPDEWQLTTMESEPAPTLLRELPESGAVDVEVEPAREEPPRHGRPRR